MLVLVQATWSGNKKKYYRLKRGFNAHNGKG